MDRVERSTRQSSRNKREHNAPYTQCKKAKSVEKPINEAKNVDDIKNMPNGAKEYDEYLMHARRTKDAPITYAQYLYILQTREEEPQMGGDTDLHNGFRENVLDAIRKPFDKYEYKRLKRMVRTGKDVYYHPDLMQKIRESQGDYPKCLKILRGFVFWLENVQREGAFMPWQDLECLALMQAD